MSTRKDTNFKANHNLQKALEIAKKDVCLSAKIRILKQITTNFNFSNFRKRCLSKRKDTNFKANHNKRTPLEFLGKDVCLSAKIRILKQITTLEIAKK